MTLIPGHISRLPVALAIALLISSCGENRPGKEQQMDDQAGPVDGTSEVAWDELTAFEEIAVMAGVLAENQDRAGLLAYRTALLESGWAVSPKTMPENVSDPDRVHQLLGKLTRLVNGLATSDISDEDLFTLARGLYPAVEELNEASGLPRVGIRQSQ